uniref:Ig-like domain-containing protein n=1 Tax=Oreochromis aureus TaxID=47969 RepID=A0AAZ1XPD0_OREAU
IKQIYRLHFTTFLLSFPGLTAGDSITPQQTEVTETEGESVKLTCSYQTSYSGIYLHWYRHDSDLQAPQFILWKGAKDYSAENSEAKDRFDAEVDKKENSVPLKIQKLQLSDSAVYYCAVRPTVTGNTKTLYKNLWSKDNRILHNIH